MNKKIYKKIFTVLTVLLLLFCGCGSGFASLREAPKMTVTAGDEKIHALRGTFSWTWPGAGIEADGMSPLDIFNDLPEIRLPADRKICFQFEYMPEKITLSAWKAAAADLSVKPYDDPDLTIEVADNCSVRLPDDDTYIIQAHAVWNKQHETGGDAYYGFISEPDR